IAADHADRHDRRVATHRETGDTRVPSVQLAITRPRALGVYPEHLAPAQHVGCRCKRPLARGPTFAPNRNLPAAAEEPCGLRIVEVLGLGDERDTAAHDERNEDRVEERAMVAGQDDRPAPGEVIATFDLHAYEHTDDRGEDGLE